jgi:hypothetical protein
MKLDRLAGRRMPGVAALVAVLAVSACAMNTGTPGATDAMFRPLVDPPARFVTSDGVPGEDGCRTTMVDPRDQTQLRLARSWLEGSTFRGDYEVPLGRYGVREGELLRMDCASGEPIGIVRN